MEKKLDLKRSHHCYSQDLAFRSIQQFLLRYAQQTGEYQGENKQTRTGHRGKKADGGGRSLSHLSPPHTRITDYSVSDGDGGGGNSLCLSPAHLALGITTKPGWSFLWCSK